MKKNIWINLWKYIELGIKNKYINGNSSLLSISLNFQNLHNLEIIRIMNWILKF